MVIFTMCVLRTQGLLHACFSVLVCLAHSNFTVRLKHTECMCISMSQYFTRSVLCYHYYMCLLSNLIMCLQVCLLCVSACYLHTLLY